MQKVMKWKNKNRALPLQRRGGSFKGGIWGNRRRRYGCGCVLLLEMIASEEKEMEKGVLRFLKCLEKWLKEA